MPPPPASVKIWVNIPNNKKNNSSAATVPTGPEDADFTTQSINYQSQLTGYTVGTFLTNAVFTNTSANWTATGGAGGTADDIFLLINGQAYLTTGSNNFVVAHDDGVVLSFPDLGGIVLNQPGPTAEAFSPFTVIAPSNGLYNFTLQYVECCGPDADLVFIINGMVVGTNTLPIAGCTNVTVTLGANTTVCSTNVGATRFNNGSGPGTPGNTVTYNAIPPGPYPIGTTPVTLWVIENNGLSNSCSTSVSVLYNRPSTVSPPPNLSVFTAPGLCFATNVALGTATATNSCNVAIASLTNNAPAQLPIGTNLVTWTATDIYGNTSSAQQKVVVRITTAPVITCPTNMVLTTDPGRCSRSNVTFTVTAFTGCSSVAVSSVPASDSTFPVGITTVTNTATDTNGNSSQCTFTVTVQDKQPPVISTPANITVSAAAGQCTTNVVFTVTATDNCGVTNLVSTPASGSAFSVGTTTVTNTAKDASGNTSQTTFTVTVIDTQPPVIATPADITVIAATGQCTSNVTFTVTAMDNCSGVASLVSTPASGFAFPVGTTVVTNTATDGRGNTSQSTFNVSVIDTQPPVITTPTNLTVNVQPGLCASNVTFAVTAIDNCGNVANLVSQPTSGFAFPLGVTTVTNTAMDAYGNTSQSTFTITVLDNQPPIINTPANITVSTATGMCASNVTFTVTATDNCTVTNLVSVPPSGYAFPAGITTVTNTATDSSGNVSQSTFTVTVVDNQPPVITTPANITVNTVPGLCTSNVTFTVTATDNCGVANLVSTPASGFAFPVGVTTVTNTAIDSNGNTSQSTFNVTVVDNQPPVIHTPVNLTVDTAVSQCTTNVTFSVTATDNCGIASLVSAPASGFAFPVGITTVTNTATDLYGNKSQSTFTITVLDNQPPLIQCPPDLQVSAATGNLATVVSLGTPMVSDNCGIVSISSNAPASLQFPVGTNQVIWTATDSAGNTSTCVQQLVVVSTTPPVIGTNADLVLTTSPGLCSQTNVTLSVPAASGQCSAIAVTNNQGAASQLTFAMGTNLVVWTATDNCGNSVTSGQRVIVVDNEPPMLNVPPDVFLVADPGTCASTNVVLGDPEFSDNCGVVNVTNDAPSAFIVGATVVNWKAVDGSGNQTVGQQLVFIEDTQPPSVVCPPDLTIPAGNTNPVSIGTAVANDNCEVISVSSNAPAQFPPGDTLVVWTVTDSSFNTATCVQRVSVNGQLPLQITCPSDLFVNTDPGSCFASVADLGKPHTTHNQGNTTITNNAPASMLFPVGTNLVTWTAISDSTNQASCVQRVVVTDIEPPTILCPSDLIVTNSGSDPLALSLDTPAVDDNCAVTGVSSNAPAEFPIGTNVVTWTAVDASGNSSTCQQNVIVLPCGGFTIQPLTNQTACSCGMALFQAQATSPDPLTYAWSYNGSAMSGATNSYLLLSDLNPASAGTYTVNVTSPCANLSSSATLSVLAGGGNNPSVFNNPAAVDSPPPSANGGPVSSTNIVTCVPLTVTNIAVTLNGFSHGNSANAHVLLANPQGKGIKLMSNAGGNHAVNNLTLTFSETATNLLPFANALVGGTFLPTDFGGSQETFAVPAPPYVTNLSTFNGMDANGPWSLDGYDSGDIAGGWNIVFYWQDTPDLLVNPKINPDRSFQVTLQGVSGLTHVIEGSIDLVHWVPLGIVTDANNHVFIDSSLSWRFYRSRRCQGNSP